MKIKTIAQIEAGQTFSRNKLLIASEGDTCLIEPRLMGMGAINHEEAKRIQYSGKKLLQPNDVLFVSRGKFESAIYESNQPAVATNAFFVLHPSKRVLSGYLSAFLNSHQAHHYFRQKQKQTTAKFVSKEDLLELDIPVVSIEKQQQLLQATNSLQRTEQTLSRKAQILKNIREGLFSQIQGVSA